MALVPDQKFSTFQDGGDVTLGDIVVGLRDGINTRFNYTGELPPGYVVPVINGGTGATTASGARINLGLGTMAVQDANAVDITGGTAALTSGQVADAPVNPTDLVNKAYVDASSVSTIVGTANQVLANGTSGSPVAGVVTLTLPQSIATTSAVQFNSVQFNSNDAIYDLNGNVIIHFKPQASAVNYLNINNNVTGQGAGMEAAGADAAISLTFRTKSTGQFGFYSEDASAPIQFFTGTGNQHFTYFNFANTSAVRTVTFPDASGTVAFTSDIPSLGDFTFTGDTMSTATTDTNLSIIPNGTGAALLGSTTPTLTPSAGTISLQIAKNSSQGLLSVGSYTAADTGPGISFLKSRSTTIGTFSAVQSGDVLCNFNIYGDDGTSYGSAKAQILGTVSGAVSTGIVPTAWTFKTTNTSGSLLTALTISNAQVITLANALPIASGGTGVTSVTSLPTASAWAGWDSNRNLRGINCLSSSTTTVTSASSYSINLTKNRTQVFTGSTAQTIYMASFAGSNSAGYSWVLINNSSANLNVYTATAAAIGVVPPNATALLTQISIADDTAASWAISISPKTYGTNVVTALGLATVGDTSNGIALSADGTFTPVLRFGGGSTGITYSTQLGNYSRVGNTVTFSIQIVLTNKGSSTGTATLAGMPVALRTGAAIGVFYTLLEGVTYTGTTGSSLPAGGTTLTFFAIASAGSASVIADTAFTNTSKITISGSYLV